jgi:hypothetical protein
MYNKKLANYISCLLTNNFTIINNITKDYLQQEHVQAVLERILDNYPDKIIIIQN